jgi:hypothetical protein
LKIERAARFADQRDTQIARLFRQQLPAERRRLSSHLKLDPDYDLVGFLVDTYDERTNTVQDSGHVALLVVRMNYIGGGVT